MYCSCHRNNGYLWEILSSGILAKLSHSFVLVFNVQKKNCWTLEKTGTPFSRWMSGMPLLKVGYFLYFNPYLKAKEDIHKSLNWVHCKIMLLYGSYSPNVSFFSPIDYLVYEKVFSIVKRVLLLPLHICTNDWLPCISFKAIGTYFSNHFISLCFIYIFINLLSFPFFFLC